MPNPPIESCPSTEESLTTELPPSSFPAASSTQDYPSFETGAPHVMNGAIDQTDMYGRVSVVDGTVRSSDVTVVVDNRTQETAEQVGRTSPSGTMQELGDGSDSNWIEAMVAAIQRAEAQEARRNLNDGQISPTSMIAVTLKNEDSDSANRAVASNAGNETVDDDASPAHFNSSGVEDDNGDDGHTLPIIVEAPLPIIWTHSEPTLWWWKQRQTQLLMGTLVLVVIGFSIALAFHRQASTDEQVAAVIVVFSSAAPSFSMTPSSSLEQFTTMAPALPWVTCAVDPDCGATLDTWMDISGLGIADLMSGTANLAIIPNKTERLGYLLEAPSNTDDNYVSRMKGWLKPPVTGEYVFWISSDDYGEFWMSSDDHPDNKVCMCFMPGSTEIREWTKYPEQESISVPLVAGGAYYFEALFKEGESDNHLAIAWQYPSQTLEVVPAYFSRLTRPAWPLDLSISPLSMFPSSSPSPASSIH